MSTSLHAPAAAHRWHPVPEHQALSKVAEKAAEKSTFRQPAVPVTVALSVAFAGKGRRHDLGVGIADFAGRARQR